MDSLQIKMKPQAVLQKLAQGIWMWKPFSTAVQTPFFCVVSFIGLPPLPGGVSQCECSLTVPAFPVSGILGSMVGFCRVLENQRMAEVARNLLLITP